MGRVIRSPKYRKWIKDAQALMMAQRHLRGRTIITGPFTAQLILNPPTNRGRDSDNYLKAPLDFAQRMMLFSNDKNAVSPYVVWGTEKDAPYGARLILTPVSS